MFASKLSPPRLSVSHQACSFVAVPAPGTREHSSCTAPAAPVSMGLPSGWFFPLLRLPRPCLETVMRPSSGHVPGPARPVVSCTVALYTSRPFVSVIQCCPFKPKSPCHAHDTVPVLPVPSIAARVRSAPLSPSTSPAGTFCFRHPGCSSLPQISDLSSFSC